jgi:EpsI family protein
MSATDLSTPPPSPSVPTRPSRVAHAPSVGVAWVWVRVLLACAVLLGSAVVRRGQSERIQNRLDKERRGPAIQLAEIPTTLGPWKGKDTALDPLIARATGADQIVTRRYVNQDTGAAIDLIMEYGPAVEMYVHSPEVCYPAAGYAQVAGPDSRPIKVGKTEAPFRSLVYSKGEGAPGELQEVYYSWWYGNRWNPSIGVQKYFERIPSMYKIHLARHVTASEKRDVGNPCESLLQELLPEIDRRMKAKQSPHS